MTTHITVAHIVVFSSLFPSRIQPNAGLFVRERMFRVGERISLTIVAPTPWFPLQSLLKRWRPHFRPGAPRHEIQSGHDVWYPRFFSIPRVFKQFDGLAMALGALPRMLALKRAGRLDLIDAHFGYPDGYAASLLSKWLNVPLTITLRGSERTYVESPAFRKRIAAGLRRALRAIGVSQSLCQLASSLGVAPDRIIQIPNGVDSAKFHPVDRKQARERLNISADAPVIISVGWLIERKGFHRVIDCLPELIDYHPGLRYLIVGGATGADSMEAALRQQVSRLNLDQHVRFLGPMEQSEINWALSAADLFVLATRREGWANVFLEAMACGLPVITTDVDGNAEVVCRPELGMLVPFGDHSALRNAIDQGLNQDWERARIREYALANSWDRRIEDLHAIFNDLI